jgi:nodulation protein F
MGRIKATRAERRGFAVNQATDPLADDIVKRIGAIAQPDDGQPITLKSTLSSLGIQSLELTEIIFDIEENYGIEVEMNTVDAWSKLKNVGDIVAAVRKLVEAKAAPHAAV